MEYAEWSPKLVKIDTLGEAIEISSHKPASDIVRKVDLVAKGTADGGDAIATGLSDGHIAQTGDTITIGHAQWSRQEGVVGESDRRSAIAVLDALDLVVEKVSVGLGLPQSISDLRKSTAAGLIGRCLSRTIGILFNGKPFL